MRAVPVILIAMLLTSLVESLFVLPNHLSHLPGPGRRPSNVLDRACARSRAQVDRGLQWFVEGPLDRGLGAATRHPAIVVAAGLGALVLSVALVPAGIVRVNFGQEVEGDIATATASSGRPRESRSMARACARRSGPAGAIRLLRRRGAAAATGPRGGSGLRASSRGGARRRRRRRALSGPHAGRGRRAAQSRGGGQLGGCAVVDSSPERPAGHHDHRRRGRGRDHGRGGQRHPGGHGPSRVGGRQSRAHVSVRRRAAATERVPGRPAPRLRPGPARNPCAAGDPARIVRQAADRHGRRPLRGGRRHPGPPDPGNRHELRIHDGSRGPLRRRRERLSGDDGLHRPATAGRGAREGRGHRGRQGTLSPDLPDVADHFPRLYAPLARNGAPGPVPDPVRRIHRLRRRHRYRHADARRACAANSGID